MEESREKNEKKLCCGPDVTLKVLQVLDDVKLKYKNAPQVTKDACSSIAGLGNWDIMPLILYKSWVDIPCSNGNIGAKSGTACQYTVQFFDRCYHAAVVNYTLWGVIEQLCDLILPYHGVYNILEYGGSPHYETQKSMVSFGAHYAKMNGSAEDYIKMVEQHKIKLLEPFRPKGHDGYGGKCENCCGKYSGKPSFPGWNWHWGTLKGSV